MTVWKINGFNLEGTCGAHGVVDISHKVYFPFIFSSIWWSHSLRIRGRKSGSIFIYGKSTLEHQIFAHAVIASPSIINHHRLIFYLLSSLSFPFLYATLISIASCIASPFYIHNMVSSLNATKTISCFSEMESHIAYTPPFILIHRIIICLHVVLAHTLADSCPSRCVRCS